MSAPDPLLAFGHEAAEQRIKHSEMRKELNLQLRAGEVSPAIWSDYLQRATTLRGDLEVLRALVGKVFPERLSFESKAHADYLANLQGYLLALCDAHLSFIKRIEWGQQVRIRDTFNPLRWLRFWRNGQEYEKLMARMEHFGSQLKIRHESINLGAKLEGN